MSSIRALAVELAARSDDALRTLFDARPDLVSPPVPDFAALAARACARASVARALDKLDLPQTQVLEAVHLSTNEDLERTATAATLQPLIEGSSPDVLDGILDQLRALALLYRAEPEGYLPVSSLKDVIGVHPAGLGRSYVDLVRSQTSVGTRLLQSVQALHRSDTGIAPAAHRWKPPWPWAIGWRRPVPWSNCSNRPRAYGRHPVPLQRRPGRHTTQRPACGRHRARHFTAGLAAGPRAAGGAGCRTCGAALRRRPGAARRRASSAAFHHRTRPGAANHQRGPTVQRRPGHPSRRPSGCSPNCWPRSATIRWPPCGRAALECARCAGWPIRCALGQERVGLLLELAALSGLLVLDVDTSRWRPADNGWLQLPREEQWARIATSWLRSDRVPSLVGQATVHRPAAGGVGQRGSGVTEHRPTRGSTGHRHHQRPGGRGSPAGRSGPSPADPGHHGGAGRRGSGAGRRGSGASRRGSGTIPGRPRAGRRRRSSSALPGVIRGWRGGFAGCCPASWPRRNCWV